MDNYVLILTIFGFAALGMAYMPVISQRTQISYSLLYMIIGIVLYLFFDELPGIDTVEDNELILHLTEIVVIISLMGAGLKIDQPFSFKTWKVPLKLVTITMLLCIGLVAWLGYQFFGLDLPSAILLGAVLAPTDPVLAADVQVGPPLEKDRDNIRFSLTAEGGLNDGMAFPFTWLAIVLALMNRGSEESISHWLWYHLAFKIVAGILIGWLLGRLVGFLLFYIPQKQESLEIRDGFVVLAITLISYGVTELLHGYGFVSVFVTAVTLRNYEIDHHYHRKMHSFADQVERMMVGIVLVVFGGSLINGILGSLSWKLAFFGLLFIFLIRPLSGMITLAGSKLHLKEKLAISYFGIRGIGSFFYLAFALSITESFMYKEIWSTLAFIVMVSIVVHGITAAPVIRKLDAQFGRSNDESKPQNKHDNREEKDDTSSSVSESES